MNTTSTAIKSEKEFIDGLNKRRSIYADPDQAISMANLLDTVSKDIYSEGQRFIFEMIQNADDAAGEQNNEVIFYFANDCIVVSHNGTAFSASDIEAITSAGTSTKREDETKTGYKGIGFKSVFGKSNRVSIISKAFRFRFDEAYHQVRAPWQIIPLWSETTDLPLSVQSYFQDTNYNVSTIIELSDTKSLLQDLIQLLGEGEILLFLRRISKIIVIEEKTLLYSIEKKMGAFTSAFTKLALLTDKGGSTSWIVKTFDGILVPEETRKMLRGQKAPPKLAEANQTEISFAAQVVEGRIKPLDKYTTLLYTYLPTKVKDFGFPCLANGSFLTNAARESLHDDSAWNRFLFTVIADKMTDWLQLLASSEYQLQLLHLLPTKFNQGSHPLKSAFDSSFSEHVKRKRFIPSIQGQLLLVAEAILDRTGLSQQSFIAPRSVVEFIQQKSGNLFSEGAFVNPELEQAGKLKGIGVQIFELDNVEEFFASRAFTNTHQVEQNIELIDYLKTQSDEDKQGIWFQKLRRLRFIYDEGSELRQPENGICFPTGPSTTELGKIPLIHPLVFEKIEKNTVVFEWLKKLGVKEPSDVSYITNVLIPGLRTGSIIRSDNYLQITRYLFRLHQNKELDEEMLEGLRELPLKTKGEEGIFIQAQACFLSNFYQPKLSIEGTVPEVPLVSDIYHHTGSDVLQWNLFFRAIKVKDRVEVAIINSNNDLPTLRILTNPRWVDEVMAAAQKKGGFGFGEHNVIKETRVPSFLNLINTNLEYAKLFWNNVLANESMFSEMVAEASFRYGIGNGENAFAYRVQNYFPWFIKNRPCIPTTTKEIRLTTETYINQQEVKQVAGEYLPVFDTDRPLSSDWLGVLNFKTRLEIEDYLLLLQKIASDVTEEGTVKKSNLRRLGIIYQRLTNLLSDIAADKKEIIKEWANVSHLLSINQRFEPANTLKWIKEEGFKMESETLRLIQIPDVNLVLAPAFPEFMSLLGVTIIDHFNPEYEALQLDLNLKRKLEKILPYFILILEKNYHLERDEEFNRLYAVLESTRFYTTAKITLSFDHMGERVVGPSLQVYESDNSFYFTGNWKSPVTFYELLPKLYNHLKVAGGMEEFRLMLSLEPEEIREWMVYKGFSLQNLHSPQPFTYQPQLADYDPTNNSTADLSDAVDPQEIPLHEEVDNDVTFLYQSNQQTPFIAQLSPKDIDAASVVVTRKNYEEIETNVSLPRFSQLDQSEDRTNVGRWSEEYAYNYFSTHPELFSNVIWENEKGESGMPYDFRCIENGTERFIDVKGTPSAVKDEVHLSGAEWKFMHEQKEAYSIFRVYEAGKATVRMERIDDLSQLILDGKLSLLDIWIQI